MGTVTWTEGGEQALLPERQSQAVAKAFASVYYNNADKEIQFH